MPNLSNRGVAPFRVRSGEGDGLRDLRLRALLESPSAFGSTFSAESDRPTAYWDELARAWSDGDDGAAFVAEAEGAWVGIAAGIRRADQLGFVAQPGTVHLASMWVSPEARNTGLGRQLTDEVVAWARATGAREVELWVTRTTQPSRSSAGPAFPRSTSTNPSPQTAATKLSVWCWCSTTVRLDPDHPPSRLETVEADKVLQA